MDTISYELPVYVHPSRSVEDPAEYYNAIMAAVENNIRRDYPPSFTVVTGEWGLIAFKRELLKRQGVLVGTKVTEDAEVVEAVTIGGVRVSFSHSTELDKLQIYGRVTSEGVPITSYHTTILQGSRPVAVIEFW